MRHCSSNFRFRSSNSVDSFFVEKPPNDGGPTLNWTLIQQVVHLTSRKKSTTTRKKRKSQLKWDFLQIKAFSSFIPSVFLRIFVMSLGVPGSRLNTARSQSLIGTPVVSEHFCLWGEFNNPQRKSFIWWTQACVDQQISSRFLQHALFHLCPYGRAFCQKRHICKFNFFLFVWWTEIRL